MSNIGRLNISLIAQEAGVSITTVSRVINERPDVSPETRQRIREIIERLGYQPNAIARSLVSRRTRTLGLITSDISDPFFAGVIIAAEEEARQQDYLFMLGTTTHKPQDEPEYFRLLLERQVEGILLVRPSIETKSQTIDSLLEKSIPPIVTIAFHLPRAPLTVVDVDNVDGAKQATDSLLHEGHHQIAMITGPAEWKSVKDRTRGYQLALAQANMAFDTRLVVQGDWSHESGYRALQELMRRGYPFSALFAQNDRMAIGALRALREAGQRVPQDVAVVGYDDMPAAAYADPPLTTIRQPVHEVGTVATHLLIQAIEQPNENQEKEVLLKTELIRRQSS